MTKRRSSKRRVLKNSATVSKVCHGIIYVYDRQARSDVVEAFRRAKWKPVARAMTDASYNSGTYEYLSRDASDGTPRYVTHGTEEAVRRLEAAIGEIRREGGGGFECYLDEG